MSDLSNSVIESILGDAASKFVIYSVAAHSWNIPIYAWPHIKAYNTTMVSIRAFVNAVQRHPNINGQKLAAIVLKHADTLRYPGKGRFVTNLPEYIPGKKISAIYATLIIYNMKTNTYEMLPSGWFAVNFYTTDNVLSRAVDAANELIDDMVHSKTMLDNMLMSMAPQKSGK